MIKYEEIKYHVPNKLMFKTCRKLPKGLVLLLIAGCIAMVIVFLRTHGGLTKRSLSKTIPIQNVRSFTGRKPKVYRTSDIDMDPLRIASPYYKMKIPQNSTCKEKRPVLHKYNLPLTALISYPGSGSTWVRHLVQQLTGIATGSPACRRKLKTSKSFAVGECVNNGKVIVINSNDRYRHKKFEKRFAKLIILYRDPFDTLRSVYSSKHPGHSESVDSEIFNVRGWYEFVRDHTTLWERYYTEWLEAERPVFLLYYEDLKTNLPATLKKLAHFLEWRVHKKDIDCTVVTSEGHFHRRHVHNITNSEIFVGKLWHKLEDAELNLAEIASERRKAGNYIESGTRLRKILEKADEEDKEDTSL
ncbi:WSC domain-containing protein 1-like [Mytilus californianus]|uniref:WSC domain-containing protein 1-like n=1 Tax=Mytilus californianus TaxID=6549 RepID=UPI002246FA4C|nr:WSC domain-containing protein 1-like [Mytilus californianus]